MGVRKGHVVAICTENRREYWSTVIGIICTGATLTAVNPMYSKDETIHVLNISKPTHIFCSPTVYKTKEIIFNSLKYIKNIFLFGDVRPHNITLYNDLASPVNSGDINSDLIANGRLTRHVRFEEFQPAEVQGQSDVVIILYSSGTTGLPKGVMLTHLNMLAFCNMPLSLDPATTGLSVTPWYHTMALTNSLSGMTMGKTTVYLPKFDIDLYSKSIEKYKIKQILVVPPIVVSLCKTELKYDMSSLEVMYCGAAPLMAETIASLKTKFPNFKGVVQGYGMTESAHAVIRGTHDKVLEFKPGSIGVVSPNCIVKVVDIETRKPLGPHKPGEICVKGPSIMKGYLGADTSSAFDDEGFYKTGDVAYYDDDGYFYIVDRLKELIKYKGHQVPPAEVEAVLLKHEAVADVGVIGLPDQLAGELPMAFVVKQPGKSVTEKELQDYVAERLSHPKRLRGGVRFVYEIPKNPSGKILRKNLRAMLNDGKSKL
ncbi:luciferin 4-monooxygenase-like [Aphomia sociella]